MDSFKTLQILIQLAVYMLQKNLWRNTLFATKTPLISDSKFVIDINDNLIYVKRLK